MGSQQQPHWATPTSPKRMRPVKPPYFPSTPSSSTRPAGTMHCLVVCGATDASKWADGAFFSDFMGISLTFKQLDPECNGTFLSCFPLEDHFQWLSTRTPPIDTIKWGRFGPRDLPLFTYSRRQWMTRQDKWFEEVRPQDLLGRVTQWIIDKRSQVAPGDCINIVFECHGSRLGNLALGTRVLSSDQLAELIRIYRPGVQVNAVGSQCYLGVMVDKIRALNQTERYAVGAASSTQVHWTASRSASNRLRNFKFSQPFVQSLAKIKIPGLPQQSAPPITLAQHEQYMRQEMQRVTSRYPRSQDYTSSIQLTAPDTARVLLEEIMLQDHVDVAYLRQSAHRRRRAEYPILDLPLWNNVRRGTAPSAAAATARQTSAIGLIRAAAGACDPDFPWPEDGGILGRLETPNPDYENILKLMYWRARKQSAIWDLFCILYERGFLYIEALAEPINWADNPPPIAALCYLMECFSLVDQEHRLMENPPFPVWEYSDAATVWLAAMICRKCSDINGLLATIEFTNFLGFLRPSAVEGYRDCAVYRPSITCDLSTMAGRAKDHFGFWLPHGLGTDWSTYGSKIRTAVNRFNRIETVYKQYFGLSDEQLLLETQQDPFFRARPDREPRLKHSGHWQPHQLASPPLSPNSSTITNILQTLGSQ